LVRGDLAGTAATVLVQDGQQGTRAATGRTGETTQLRDRGGFAAEQDGEQSAGCGQADPEGLSGGRELGLLDPIHADGTGQLLLELSDLRLQVGQQLVVL